MASTKLYDYNTSFSLLRTNPALSGNFKITVDSENKVWFNSFDADPILSGSAYKKFNISGKNSFAQDVFSFFGKGSLSPEVIFKVYQTTDGNKKTAENFFGQYDFFYASGAQTLVDKNYPEDFSYFAPLWIRSEIPDYFVIFKVPEPLSYKYSENVLNLTAGSVYKVIQKYGTSTEFIVQYGEDANGVPIEYPAGTFITASADFPTYTIKSGEGSVCLFDETANLDNAENAETYFRDKILPNAYVIKTFDLRGGTVIGDYIRSIFNNPTGIAIRSSYKEVYVANTGTTAGDTDSSILKITYDSSGNATAVTTFLSGTSTSSMLCGPVGLAINGNVLYISNGTCTTNSAYAKSVIKVTLDS